MDFERWFYGVALTIDFQKDVQLLFEVNNQSEIFVHTKRALKKAEKLAKRYGFNEKVLSLAVLLHDIGRIVPMSRVLDFLEYYGVPVDPFEKEHLHLLHQKSSAVIAKELFGVESNEILNAISCHTTLKPCPSMLESLVFLSDKLSWKDEEYQSLIKAMKKASKKSLDEAVGIYLKHQYDNRQQLPCYHENARYAYMDYKFRVNGIYSLKTNNKEKRKLRGL